MFKKFLKILTYTSDKMILIDLILVAISLALYLLGIQPMLGAVIVFGMFAALDIYNYLKHKTDK